VSPWDIRFDPSDRAHIETESTGRYRFRLSAEPGLSNATLVVRSDGDAMAHPMRATAAAGRFVSWEVAVDGLAAGAEYSFAFTASNGKGVYLVPSGIANAVERLDRWRFEPPEPIAVPTWAMGAVIYQIFPDRFARGDRPTGDDELPWEATPHHRHRQGGDLHGIRQRLDHMEGLGVDVIYLNPIFTSPSNHRYDTVDYFEVDPALGGNDALRTLVTAVHDRGMRLILDTSLNHVHPRFFAFADVVQRGPRSPYRDWFTIREWPLRVVVRPRRGSSLTASDRLEVWSEQLGVPVEVVEGDGPEVEPSYDSWYDVPTMPRVNLANAEARAYMLRVAAHWVAEYGIDGWRMDVARYVDRDFWADFRTAVRTADPEAYLLCEVVGDARGWLQGDQFDATMNYTFRELAVRFLATSEIDGADFLDGAARLVAMYAWPVTLANHNLIGSHDTSRFLTVAGDELWRLRLATVLQLTFPGAPGIYYGDEVGLSGGHDPGSRGTFPWQVDPSRHPVSRTFSDLTEVRRHHPALVTGSWQPMLGRRGLIVFERRLGNQTMLVAINRSTRAAEVPVGRRARLVWGDATVADGTLQVGGRGAAVVRR
jgi:glycosidase